MALFRGFSGAYGTHGASDKNSAKGGKLEIKKTAKTVREPVTLEVWEKHLAGTNPVGIIAIDEQNESFWGCIDVDRYDIDHADAVRRLEEIKMPMVCCRTKSGGLHAYLFLAEPVPAEEIRIVLGNIAASMGWGDCEIFPKQNQVLLERGDLGNWLNMPYLGGNKSNRTAVKNTGLAMSLDEFLDTAERSRTFLQDIPRITGGNKEPRHRSGGEDTSGPLADGPPCLQHLAESGFPEGTRNNGLFAMGIYCRKRYGENWRPKLEEINRQFMTPPLTADEVLAVVRSLEKKEYNYSCRDQPLASHCESAICRGRKFGVGGTGQYPRVSGLAKLNSEPPLWFMDIEDKRIELQTSELQDYRKFQLVCMNQLTIFYMPLRAETWAAIVGDAMTNSVIIEASAEMSTSGHFLELLESFCMDRHRGEQWEDIRQGRPYLDQETNRHHFRLKDFMAHLDREGFRVWGRNKVGQELSEMGGRESRHIGGHYVNMFWVPEDIFEGGDPQHKLPMAPRDPI